jgi:hypothetical protein
VLNGRVELAVWLELVERVANQDADWFEAIELEYVTEDMLSEVSA